MASEGSPAFQGRGFRVSSEERRVATFEIKASIELLTNQYIKSQREHQRKKTFQEEFRALLTKHDIEYDERYVWG